MCCTPVYGKMRCEHPYHCPDLAAQAGLPSDLPRALSGVLHASQRSVVELCARPPGFDKPTGFHRGGMGVGA